MAEKVDLRRTVDGYRAKEGVFQVLDLPPRRYLMVDGHGDPNTSADFTTAVEALYPVAYALKFASKADGRDYVVPPLEGLWWSDDMATFTSERDKSRWSWTLLNLVPDWLDDAAFDTALDRVRDRRAPDRLGDLRLETLDEGRCVQVLHVGAYDDEAEVLARMHDEVIPGEGMRMTGRHHEIYLSDQRRVAPEKRRTILRQPVDPA